MPLADQSGAACFKHPCGAGLNVAAAPEVPATGCSVCYIHPCLCPRFHCALPMAGTGSPPAWVPRTARVCRRSRRHVALRVSGHYLELQGWSRITKGGCRPADHRQRDDPLGSDFLSLSHRGTATVLSGDTANSSNTFSFLFFF